VAIEVKLSESVSDKDVRHLNWLYDQIGARLADRVLITTGDYAYRRADGVAVVPLALLGP
jgi:predicted AAA+ superfamily ATPase